MLNADSLSNRKLQCGSKAFIVSQFSNCRSGLLVDGYKTSLIFVIVCIAIRLNIASWNDCLCERAENAAGRQAVKENKRSVGKTVRWLVPQNRSARNRGTTSPPRGEKYTI